MTTNAQAALQAAATVYGMTEGDVAPGVVTGMAYTFKRWLDAKDALDLEACGIETLPTPVLREAVLAVTLPQEGPSHHISCASRRHVATGMSLVCTCTPVPYTPKPGPRPGPTHFLTENHNADPVCHCGWDPAKLFLGLGSREEARNDVRQHVADLKP